MSPLVDRYRQMLSVGDSVENVLGQMRQDGTSRTGSIKLLMALTGQTLSDAKAVVHMSATWRDLRDDAERLHEHLEDVAQQTTKKEPPT